MSINLLEYSRGAGCGCKIAPNELHKILQNQEAAPSFPGLLVGSENMDDAAVWQVDPDRCLIATNDFFSPIVSEAFEFGKIAAVNALSDVYAMGGTPLMALGILGWPIGKLPSEMAAEVMRGAREACTEAGIPIAGGHSIDAAEPFFGLSVNGWVKPEHLKKNSTARPGARLYLSKPLGNGILSSAAKRGLLKDDEKQAWYANMLASNKAGSWLGQQTYVQAMTDITGFGLLGHLAEMARASGVSMLLEKDKVPVLLPAAVEAYVQQMVFPDGTTRNYQAVAAEVSPLEARELLLFCDPQTSGGLLFAIDPEAVSRLEKEAAAEGYTFYPVGEVSEAGKPLIQLS